MTASARRTRRRLDGVLLLDKPSGMTSNAALQAARRLFNAAKAGHTGTLDPLASGLLPICFGEATKFSQTLLDADKRYLAELRLGVRTDSADAEGAVIARRPVAVSRQAIEQVLPRFRGDIEQIPPMHSALKRDGRPLYELARQGIEVERAARRVHIHGLTLRGFADERAELEVHCSKGTYVRTLADDIGEALGCGAHLTGLRRTAIGAFDIGDAVPLDRLQSLPADALDRFLLPADALLAALPRADLDEHQTADLLQGRAVAMAGAVAGTTWRVYGAGRLLGIARAGGDGFLAPLRLIATTGLGPANSLENSGGKPV
jgi:tRNA pseudouridine55 synthase